MTKLAQDFKVMIFSSYFLVDAFFSLLLFKWHRVFQTMSVDSSESASASDGVYDDLEYLNLIFQVILKNRDLSGTSTIKAQL